MAESSIACCDCYIGITYPTQSELLMFDTDKTKNFYKIFTDNIFQTIVKHNGLVRRRISEGFEFYFLRTSDLGNFNAFNDALDCCFSLVENHNIISNEMKLNNMPEISYKVTAAYEILDLAGNLVTNKPMPTAYKIFTLTDPNASVLMIAVGLYTILIKFPEFGRYQFNQSDKTSLVGEKPNYEVYSVTRNMSTL
jgi:hypothetical protein